MVQINAARAPERKCPCGQQMTHLSDLGRTASGRESLPLLRLQQRHFRSDCLILETHDPANFSIRPFSITA